MKKNITQYTAFIFLAILLPAIAYGQTGLVPCNGSTTPCNFNTLMELINRGIQFLLFDFSIPFAAILFAYAGFILVTSGGSDEKRTQAKKIFTNVALGLVIALAAWLIVETILHALGYEGAWIGF